MKKNIFISIIALVFLSFVMVQCTKENSDEIDKNNKDIIEIRTDPDIGGEVQSPGCGLEDYVQNFLCGITDTIDTIIIAPNGCNIKVIMNVKICWNAYDPGEKYVVFSDLRWRLAPPYSFDCLNWWVNNVFTATPEDQDNILDELETYLEQTFEDVYMRAYVQKFQLDCSIETASALFFKSPCTQRCSTGPSDKYEWFFTYTTPCADDGCCVQTTAFCLLDNGTVWKSGPTVEQIRPCTNFYPVNCSKETIPVGDCKDDGCN